MSTPFDGVTVEGVDLFVGDVYHLKGPNVRAGKYIVMSVIDHGPKGGILIHVAGVVPSGHPNPLSAAMPEHNQGVDFYAKLTITPEAKKTARTKK